MYGLLPLVQLLQSGPYSHNFTNREDVGPYCPKAHEQREKKYFGGHQGRPGPLPGRLSPIKTGIITPCTNQQCGRDRSTDQHRCHYREPRAHQDCRPQKRHANSHWEQMFLKTLHDQWKGLLQHQNLPPTPALTSRWRQVMERATKTQIMLSRTKTCPRSRITRQTSRDISENSSRCTSSPQ